MFVKLSLTLRAEYGVMMFEKKMRRKENMWAYEVGHSRNMKEVT
jgi:hypothetical protein